MPRTVKTKHTINLPIEHFLELRFEPDPQPVRPSRPRLQTRCCTLPRRWRARWAASR
tara:strand:+ start:675 stop:845 length:171 start_codon:yes stop_codon:yes gene_type:complete